MRIATIISLNVNIRRYVCHSFHNGSKFQHDMVLDTTGHKWKINSYKNDILVAGCHRIAYSEMEGVARQLGWD